MYVELQFLSQHLKQLKQQQELLQQQIAEMSMASQGLDDFTQTENGAEMLVPLSSGIFAKAKIMDTENLLMNVGAGVCVMKDVPAAKALMKRQIEESHRFAGMITVQVEKFSQKATELQRRLQSLMPAE